MESNHKCNAKQPSGQTQRRADTFKLQTSRCYIRNLLLDKAVSKLEETYPLSIIKKLEPPLVGAKFSIQLTNDRDDNLLLDATIIWGKSQCIKSSYHPRFLGWLCSNILAVLGQDVPIRGCTEHKWRTPTGDKFIFRAHPSWRSGRSWHDWALFSWTDTDETPNQPSEASPISAEQNVAYLVLVLMIRFFCPTYQRWALSLMFIKSI
jgi:hypothetical protein